MAFDIKNLRVQDINSSPVVDDVHNESNDHSEITLPFSTSGDSVFSQVQSDRLMYRGSGMSNPVFQKTVSPARDATDVSGEFPLNFVSDSQIRNLIHDTMQQGSKVLASAMGPATTNAVQNEIDLQSIPTSDFVGGLFGLVKDLTNKL